MQQSHTPRWQSVVIGIRYQCLPTLQTGILAIGLCRPFEISIFQFDYPLPKAGSRKDMVPRPTQPRYPPPDREHELYEAIRI